MPPFSSENPPFHLFFTFWHPVTNSRVTFFTSPLTSRFNLIVSIPRYGVRMRYARGEYVVMLNLYPFFFLLHPVNCLGIISPSFRVLTPSSVPSCSFSPPTPDSIETLSRFPSAGHAPIRYLQTYCSLINHYTYSSPCTSTSTDLHNSPPTFSWFFISFPLSSKKTLFSFPRQFLAGDSPSIYFLLGHLPLLHTSVTILSSDTSIYLVRVSPTTLSSFPIWMRPRHLRPLM